ncbi:MAG: riboflavin biosynthesis protein RibF [Wolbachia endosymbiont of Menacanthus eurysternus]|nr:MAG: riboflavin biosynthesis protein RibF [Wolbachia endosymbiont of Menacanthus eurysternus]
MAIIYKTYKDINCMKIIYDHFDHKYKINSGVVLTFGNFDGLHLGHELIISTVKSIAVKRKLPSVILTFEPHPLVLFGKNNFKLINQKQKRELISSCGVDYLYIIDFNESFSKINCSDFITKILIDRCNTKHIVVGKSCTFGYNRFGNVLTLREYCKTGYSLTELEPLIIEGKICSSSLIRKYLQEGKTEIANKLLGKPYQVSGIVTKGACRGREIGFPTINIPIEDYMIKPKFGTYYAKAAFFDINLNCLYDGVANIGIRPTLKDLKKPIVEMHIFDFSEDVYGYKADVQLLKFIRSEKRFHSIDELTKQINCDVIKAYQLRTNL